MVKRRGAEKSRNGSVIHDSDAFRSHARSQFTSQKRSLLIDRGPLHSFKDLAKQRASCHRIEYHGNFLRGHFASAQPADSSFGSLSANRQRTLQRGVASRGGIPIVAFHGVAFACHRRCAERATTLP